MLWILLACSHDPVDSGPTFTYPRDDELRVTDGQFLGTHNSTHIQPEDPLSVEWEYTHAPLDVQFGEQGVRQIELDIHYTAEGGGFEVYHIPNVDAETTCLALSDCLTTIRDWSDDHPGHFPILVMVEPKDDVDSQKLKGRFDLLDEAILEVFPAQHLIRPDDLQGGYATLGEAVRTEGWPTLGDARGKVIFALLDSGEYRDEYSADQTSLVGRVLFTEADTVDDALAAVMKPDDPIADATTIAEAAAAGLLIRTRADSGGGEVDETDSAQLQAALASGANFLSTDYPAPVEGVDYVAEIPDGTPGRCNPVTAPADCVATEIEDPEQLY